MVTTTLNNITFEDFEKYYKPSMEGQTTCTILAQHEPIYVAGCKYSIFFIISIRHVDQFLRTL